MTIAFGYSENERRNDIYSKFGKKHSKTVFSQIVS